MHAYVRYTAVAVLLHKSKTHIVEAEVAAVGVVQVVDELQHEDARPEREVPYHI